MLGVQELNELSRQALAKGYDPRSVDYSDANSIEVNRRFTEKVAEIKMKEAELRQAREFKQRAFAKGDIFSSSFNAQQMVDNALSPQSFQAVQEYNKGMSATPIKNAESYMMALQDREKILLDLQSKLDANIARAQGDEVVIAKLLDEHKNAVIGLQMPRFEGMSDKEKIDAQQNAKNLALRERKMLQDAEIEREKIEQRRIETELKQSKANTTQEFANTLTTIEEVYQTPFGNANVFGFTMPNVSVDDEVDGFFEIGKGEKAGKKRAGSAKFGRVMMLPIDSAGNPIPKGAGKGDWEGEYAPFAIGSVKRKGAGGWKEVAYPVNKIYDRIKVKERREGIKLKVGELDPLSPQGQPAQATKGELD
jgi:hypothetical protein